MICKAETLAVQVTILGIQISSPPVGVVNPFTPLAGLEVLQRSIVLHVFSRKERSATVL